MSAKAHETRILFVNVCKKKQIDQIPVRQALTMHFVFVPHTVLSLEQCMEFIKDDELLEVTPESLRLRKRILAKDQRLKQQFRKSDCLIIDSILMFFPTKLRLRRLSKLAAGSGGMEPVYDATVDGLESFLSKNAIDKAVALNISTNTHQQKSVNDFAVSLLKSDRIIPFGSVHPDSPMFLTNWKG